MSESTNQKRMPMIALKGLVMLPYNILSFEVTRSKSVEAMERAQAEGKEIFLVAQKEQDEAETQRTAPQRTELYSIGTVSEITRILPMPNNTARVIALGRQKGKIADFMMAGEYFEADVTIINEYFGGVMSNEQIALMASVKDAFARYASLNSKILPEVAEFIHRSKSPVELSYYIASNIGVKFEKKQELLEIEEFEPRFHRLLEILYAENDILKLQKEINDKVKKNVDKSQREYYLREQSKVINNELGASAGVSGEIDNYKDRMEALKLPEYVAEKLERELQRLSKSGNLAQEGVVIRDYIDWVLDIPWSEKTEDNKSLRIAEKVLNEDHYGLTEVKERILEFLAVRQNTTGHDSPVICLVGPPGVGKTSVAKSVARALNREYVRMSLGGVRDEAEIRGHRRTYIGAMPGRIIMAMKQAKTTNPLILLDEIDKLSSDYKGDPSSALLEVLDGEQNNTFRDHYIEMPYDLSDVLFLCTANTVQTIPPALYDRLEIIELSSYTLVEKENIAQKFLLQKQMKKHGIHSGVLYLEPACIKDMVRYYTKEAGVRQLERLIAKICRKAVKKTLTEDSAMPVEVYPDDLEEYLGARKFKDTAPDTGDLPGTAVGLAWTKFGGDTLVIEVNALKGKGKFEFTGNVGKVMNESAMAAVSYIRANAQKLDVDEGFSRKTDIHIHIPEGAVSKDGPSAGISMCTAIISALSGKRVNSNLAMTGEITLRGRVLPVGGLKEKILAAKSAGITRVILPYLNEGDVKDIDSQIKEGMDIIFVKTMDEVCDIAFGC